MGKELANVVARLEHLRRAGRNPFVEYQVPHAAIARDTSPLEQKGRAASCTNTISGAPGLNASRPASTESCREAPPYTGGISFNPLAAASYDATSSRWMTACRCT